MFRRPTDPSIRKQLLFWLGVPLTCVWLATTIITCFYAATASQALYDQQLLDSADSVLARIDVRPDGSVRVHLPLAARRVLEHNQIDRFYFQIWDVTGKPLTHPNLISQTFERPTGSNPVFEDSQIGNMPIRKAIIPVVDPETQKPLILDVAETLNARNQLTQHILLNVFMSELAVIFFGVAAVYFAVTRALLPLGALQRDLSSRDTSDLHAVSESGVPAEVLPLVQAINDLLARLTIEIDSQKRFVANAAHQIRTPVAGLKTYVGFARRLADSAEMKKVLQQVDEGADRVTHLTNRLLSLARAEPKNRRDENFSVIDLNEVASSAISGLVSEAIKKDIELSFESSGEPALVQGNPQSLEELVTNIVENAILYTQQKGNVVVRVHNGRDVTLAVEDNGPGIPAEEREQVFERFYRVLGTEQTGSGLGLAIVKEIAAAHHARVSINGGKDGKGTLVTVQLPKAS